MRTFKPLALVSLGSIAIAAEFNTGCSSPGSLTSPRVLTTFVTVPASPLTQTVYLTKGYPGYGINGWNASLTTLVKSTAMSTGIALSDSTTHASANKTSISKTFAKYATPTARGPSPRQVKARQVGEVIEATIDGTEVSWTNSFDGTSPSTSGVAPASTIIPATATAPSFIGIPSPSNSALPKYGNTSTVGAFTETSSCQVSSGLFTVNFDDLPYFSTGPGDTDIPPIFNPYRKLYWEGHFGYVPPPSDPFPPHSPPQLAVYRVEAIASSNSGSQLPGEFGAGPRAGEGAYRIDAYSAWIGCADGGPSDCTITIIGYLDGETDTTVEQVVTELPCPGFNGCSLKLVNFEDGFRAMTGLQIIATVEGKAVDYYMDDINIGWSDNSCAAQAIRASGE